MIVTLTPNPSLDRSVVLAHPLRPGSVARVGPPVVEPGGKGINVARVIAMADGDVRAVLPARPGDPMLAALDERGLAHVGVSIDQPIRTNLTIAEPDGRTTKLNEPGPTLSENQVEALIEALVTASREATWVALCGSLPPGVHAGLYSRIVTRLASSRCRVAVDTSGAALAAALGADAPHLPNLIKPNDEELAELTRSDPDDLRDNPERLSAVARELLGGNLEVVLLTLGAAGALAVTTSGTWLATPPPITARSTVGAGDSSLAGWLLADAAGHDAATSLQWAVAYGSAAASLPGSGLPRPDQTDPDAVRVEAMTFTHPR